MARRHPEDEQEERDNAARMQARGLGIIVAFLVVGMISLGLYALWRQFSGVRVERQVGQEVTEPTANATEPSESERIEQLVDSLTLEQKVAQLFIVTPEALTNVGVAIKAGDATREAANAHPVGGVCYFSQNLVDRKQTEEMLRNTKNYIKDACGLVPFMCVDEEGGTVARVAENAAFGVTNPGDMSAIGAGGDENEAREVARKIGSYLKELGFNVDFAPVADIVTSQDSVMYERSFGSSADLVSKMVVAQVEGFQKEGMLCSAKHFPGIGDSEGDSHNGRIYSHKNAEEMKEQELVPFVAAIKAGVPMVMVGHVSCLELGRGEGDLPASLSPAVINGLLRTDLGYDGLVVTDALNMGALEGVCADDEVGMRAIEAGADLILMPENFESAYNGLLKAVKSGKVSEERVNESIRRIARVKLKLAS